MRISPLSIAIGFAIGAIALALPVMFLLAAPSNAAKEDDSRVKASFFLGGYLKDLSEDTMTLNQSIREDWLEDGQVSEIDLHIRLDHAGIYNCAPATNTVSDCVELFRNGEVPVGTSVCAHTRLIDNQLYGGKVFFNMSCDLPPRL